MTKLIGHMFFCSNVARASENGDYPTSRRFIHFRSTQSTGFPGAFHHCKIDNGHPLQKETELLFSAADY